MKLKQILAMTLIWQLVTILVLAMALQYFPLQKTFLGGGSRVYQQNPYLYSRGNFDGLHYVYIATRGYGYAEQAFFPFYPKLLKQVNLLVRNPYLSGVIISLTSFVVGLWFLSKLLALDFKQEKIYWIILSLLVFPTSFYFGAVYTESLFFLFVIMAFYFARKGNWLLAGIVGGLASCTRFIGIFLLPALLVEWSVQNRNTLLSKKSLVVLSCLMLVPTGLLYYMNYLRIHTGDPLAFIHTLPAFGTYRSSTVVMLYQVFWRYAKMILTVEKGTLLYSGIIYEVATGGLFLILSIVAFYRLRLSYAVFIALSYLVPTLTGSFVSLPRYVLVCFPGFIILGSLLHKNIFIRKLYFIVCIVTFILLSGMFSLGYWVA